MEGLLVFDLVGPMAHFRKFYANSSSLSYPLPPRTTLAGILAALLGRERDEYYGEFSLERARIGVAVRSPVRMLMQTINYLNTKERGWDGRKGHTQIPLELVLPRSPERLLRYRIYFTHEDESLLKKIYAQLQQEHYKYPLFLGLTECPAWTESARMYESDQWQILENPDRALPIETAVPLQRLDGEVKLQEGVRIYKDRMPLDFDTGRKLKAVGEILWEAEGNPLNLRIKGEVFELPEQDKFGVFLEPA